MPSLGWTPQQVDALLLAVQPLVRLQQPLTDNGTALQDVVEDTQTPPPEVLVVPRTSAAAWMPVSATSPPVRP